MDNSNTSALISLLPCNLIRLVQSVRPLQSSVSVELHNACPEYHRALNWNPAYPNVELDVETVNKLIIGQDYIDAFINPKDALTYMIDQQGWKKVILLYDRNPGMINPFKHIVVKTMNACQVRHF